MKKISDRELVGAALEAGKHAYAPYSKLHVGAAIEAEDGSLFTGCNVENASYGLTICAERAAVFAAIAAGHKALKRIAIAVGATDDHLRGLMPCGACLQVLSEFMASDGEVLIAGNGKFVLGELLPHAFRLDP